MTLKQYIEGLKTFAKNHPDALGLEVITSNDDEGNGFSPVFYDPSKGFYDKKMDIFIPEVEFNGNNFELNSVCVN